MTSPFPELRLLALIEGEEAIATNLQNAVLFEIGAIVGTQDVSGDALALNLECDIDLGDSAFADAIEKVMNALCDGFRSITSRLFEIATSFAFAIEGFIENLLDNIISTMRTIIATVTEVLSNAVANVVERLGEAVSVIIDTLATVVDTIVEQVRRVVEGIEEIISAIFDKISTVVSAILNKIGDAVSAIVESVGTILTAIKDLIGSIIATVVDSVFAVVTAIGNKIGDLIDVLVGTAEAGLGRVRQVIEDIPSTLRELATDAQEFLGTAIGGPLANIGTLFTGQTDDFFKKLIEERDKTPEDLLRDFLSDLGTPTDVADKIAGASTKLLPTSPALLTLAGTAIIPFVLGPVISAIVSPVTDQIRQEVAQRVTPTLIPPADTIDAFVRGFMNEASFRNELGEAGFNTTKQDILVATSRRLIDVGEIFRWWLRDIITEDQLNELLRFHKIDSDDRERLKEAVFFIPPVQDLIRMAVREVFTPDIRQQFQLDEGFPVEFQEAAKQQAVSEAWAKNYWAAHWVLPSVTQGFAMLHRKVISAEELDLLLRAQDVMPFWREKITQVAFHPLTRVDVRRMHRLGLIDEEQLQLRYEDLGFAPDNASLMVEFTKEFNKEDPTEDEIELAGLTRGTILGMFDDGILNEDDTKTALLDLGISEAAADLFITQRKLELERANRTTLIENIIRLAGGGHISLDRAQDGLAGLGLTATEVAIAVQRILRNRDARDRLPTLAQLDKMRAKDIVTEAQWQEAMSGLGFSDVWIDRLGKLRGGDVEV